MQGLCLLFLPRREVRCPGGPLPSADISTQQFEQSDLFVDDSYFLVGSLCLCALLVVARPRVTDCASPHGLCLASTYNLWQLPRCFVPTETNYRANCHDSSWQLPREMATRWGQDKRSVLAPCNNARQFASQFPCDT